MNPAMVQKLLQLDGFPVFVANLWFETGQSTWGHFAFDQPLTGSKAAIAAVQSDRPVQVTLGETELS